MFQSFDVAKPESALIDFEGVHHKKPSLNSDPLKQVQEVVTSWKVTFGIVNSEKRHYMSSQCQKM